MKVHDREYPHKATWRGGYTFTTDVLTKMFEDANPDLKELAKLREVVVPEAKAFLQAMTNHENAPVQKRVNRCENFPGFSELKKVFGSNFVLMNDLQLIRVLDAILGDETIIEPELIEINDLYMGGWFK